MTTGSGDGQAHPVHELVNVMGTVVTVDVYARKTLGPADLAVLRGQVGRAANTLRRADAVFSTWQPASPMSRLRSGSISREQAPAEVIDVLERCAIARDLSGGWFDPWAMPGGVDPTGMVKGWAAQQALAALSTSLACGAIINAAGDIASFGGLGDGQPFRIGIADPADPRNLAEIVELRGAIATSGSYERGRHLVNPRTGRLATAVASASVTGPDLGLADALATALAVAGEMGLAFIGPLDDYEALVIGPDGARRATERFPFARAQP